MPIPADGLFTEAELAEWLGVAVTAARATVVEKVVWGWLKPVLKLDVRPQPVPEQVFSWAIELGAIAHENPSGLSAKQMGPFQRQFSSERRDEIIEEAAGGGDGVPPPPTGCFPKAEAYPDPAWTW